MITNRKMMMYSLYDVFAIYPREAISRSLTSLKVMMSYEELRGTNKVNEVKGVKRFRYRNEVIRMSKLESILMKKDIPSYITPLFWQHGEDEDILRNEIKQMGENGIGGFVVESRPHPDFLGEPWWRDLDVIIDEAKKREMKVWLFDDSAYPSGYAAGRIRDHYPEYLKVFLDERHIDANGPLQGSSFIIKAWLEPGETLVAVVAARRTDGVDALDGETFIDLTGRVSDGIVYWDVPEGSWRLFMLVKTRNGGEDTTNDYLNPIDPEPVKAFIEIVYEEHYKRYGKEFGKTIAGFFSDEPRFGNAHTYEGTLGQSQSNPRHKMVLPYSDQLLGHLDKAWEGDFLRYLPCLWYEAGPITHSARYVYMDVVSTLFGENYTQQIGDWCRAHGVKYIGHLIEDNGAHARLGYGPGHFFRGIKGQDYSGMDLVYQVWPEFTSGRHLTPLGYLDADFFYWGITKMASSAGHMDPKKDGTTVCEIFGAYGWQAGLKLMKWLTDHVCVRGVNHLIPHAFTPKANDLDCPPHFYARGDNPQWRYFHLWSAYANRVCHLLSGGQHAASAAVIYHAEAEWSGDYMPFEQVVKALAQRQIDCDVVPIDTFVHREAMTLEKGRVVINDEPFKAVIVPYAKRLPEAFVAVLAELAALEIPVIFMNDFPAEASIASAEFESIMNEIRKSSYVHCSSCAELPDKMIAMQLHELETSSYEENLRTYHYKHEEEHVFFLTNESKYKAVHTDLTIQIEGTPVIFDAMHNQFIEAQYTGAKGSTRISIELQPYESLFILFNNSSNNSTNDTQPSVSKARKAFTSHEIVLTEPWKVSISEAPHVSDFSPQPLIQGLGNISIPAILPEFSGTIRYEAEFELLQEMLVPAESVLLDLGDVYEVAEVWLNNQPVGVRICPPYSFDVTELLAEGRNQLRVDVTNTLAKKRGHNLLDRAMAQEPSGLLGPVKLLT
ncbi:glycosylhydrolase-like jelly roll fold domain-containing protein [Paenibacillus eucommiae]|uniref:Glycoside hydrolase n=1 Tax=Paenibacillus eucommiae TaxID=1355755 RepID=A0ABS4J8M8_9BACL|nr:glycosylhydrolase-like jelly roll fold domain-containing protein [Paenibacillus eucommiae]MBP1995099.1 hypothetical protein [Paenibacillus eucommiae]